MFKISKLTSRVSPVGVNLNLVSSNQPKFCLTCDFVEDVTQVETVWQMLAHSQQSVVFNKCCFVVECNTILYFYLSRMFLKLQMQLRHGNLEMQAPIPSWIFWTCIIKMADKTANVSKVGKSGLKDCLIITLMNYDWELEKNCELGCIFDFIHAAWFRVHWFCCGVPPGPAGEWGLHNVAVVLFSPSKILVRNRASLLTAATAAI